MGVQRQPRKPARTALMTSPWPTSTTLPSGWSFRARRTSPSALAWASAIDSPPGGRASPRVSFQRRQSGSGRSASKPRPVHSPKSISRSASLIRRGSPRRPAMGSAVSRARWRGLVRTASIPGAGEATRQRLRLSSPRFAQADARHAAAQHVVHAVMGGVPHEENGRGHGAVAASILTRHEAQRAFTRFFVGELLGRRLHEPARRPDEGAAPRPGPTRAWRSAPRRSPRRPSWANPTLPASAPR